MNGPEARDEKVHRESNQKPKGVTIMYSEEKKCNKKKYNLSLGHNTNFITKNGWIRKTLKCDK